MRRNLIEMKSLSGQSLPYLFFSHSLAAKSSDVKIDTKYLGKPWHSLLKSIMQLLPSFPPADQSLQADLKAMFCCAKGLSVTELPCCWDLAEIEGSSLLQHPRQ